MKKLLLLGGGGHCRSVLDTVLSLAQYDEIGIIDYTDSSCLGVPVIGTDDDVPLLVKEGWTEACITVGSIGNCQTRKKLYRMAKQAGLNLPVITDPTAVVARGVKIEEGSYIGKLAVVNTGVLIGTCAIINTGALIEHDCEIGSFSHISPGSVICGQVRVGSDVHVGAGTVIRQQILVGDHALIGAGSVVVKNIPADTTSYGNPCKVIET